MVLFLSTPGKKFTLNASTVQSIFPIFSHLRSTTKTSRIVSESAQAKLSDGVGLIYGACQLNEKGRNYSHISGQCRSSAFLRELAG